MKKTVVLFLAILYVVVCSGFTTYTHLCQGVEQAISFSDYNKVDQDNCGFCKSIHKTSDEEKCCKEISKNFKLNVKTALPKSIDFSAKFLGDALPHRFFAAVFEVVATVESVPYFNFQSHTIPLPSNPLYIFYCVYRI
ncbi:HYC_CC_PP family protein [Flavobacterium sp. JP2137]|uniref:HYC_CC_PP family protein n=1 Tax=Flavobacterium sp. JP2137 TaxID=3414510 RepID=UPI003D2FF8B5